MLTGELLRVRIRRGTLSPALVRPDDEALRERAGALLDLWREAVEQRWNRARLHEALVELEGVETDIRLVRGLARILEDLTEFAIASPLDPGELRARIFRLAARRGPVAREAGVPGQPTAAELLAEVAAELACSPEAISQALYADLPDEQVLLAAELPDAEGLLHRYNTGLVQALLLRASALRVRLTAPDPKRVRQLYRALKFHRLMYRCRREEADWILEVDGPLSLLQQSSRYGLQLATFFPSLLLVPSPWRLEAELRWGPRGLRKQLALSSDLGLRSHHVDRGAWRSRTEQAFEERFAEMDSGWQIGPGEPLDLGGQELLVPDFTFRKGGRTAHLDIVGWWRKSYLQRRLQSTPPHVILAVSRRMAAEARAALPDRVIAFAEVIPARAVLEHLDRVAIPEPGERARLRC